MKLRLFFEVTICAVIASIVSGVQIEQREQETATGLAQVGFLGALLGNDDDEGCKVSYGNANTPNINIVNTS